MTDVDRHGMTLLDSTDRRIGGVAVRANPALLVETGAASLAALWTVVLWSYESHMTGRSPPSAR